MESSLPGCGSPEHSGAGEGDIEHPRVREEVKQLLDIQGFPTSNLNNILQTEGLISTSENIVDILLECVLFTDRH